jgi:hypothetical protein
LLSTSLLTGLRTRDLLEAVLEAAQPSRAQHEQAVSAYGAVSKWLADPACALAQHAPSIFPQGSFLLRTVVRPYWRHEFDLDLVTRLAVDASRVASDVVAALIRDRLVEHQGFKERLDVDRFPRCLRLKYANDFHLDVVPACPGSGASGIGVPEKTQKRRDSSPGASWKPNDPIGYATWFETRTRVGFDESIVLSKAIAPEPPYEPAHSKAPLRKFVQLIKLRRNQYYKPDDAPSSILLTTMAGEVYRGDQFTLEGLLMVVRAMSKWADTQGDALNVPNPTISSEDFASPLTNAQKQALRNFLQTYCVELSGLAQVQGIDQQATTLRELFGSQPVDRALRSIAESVNAAREASAATRLYTGRDSATLGIGIAPVAGVVAKPNPPHTFYGG